MSRFELHRFEATPVTPVVAIVELGGRFDGTEPARPRLLVESGGVEREMPALEVGGSPWSAVFAVPVAALSEEGAAFSLVPGRGPVIALPAPSASPGGDDDRFVRLARTANDLRHRLGEATERATAAAERLVEAGEERDRLGAELESVREQLAAAEARAAEAHDAALGAREEQARAEGEADVAREQAERDVAAAREEAARSVEQARAEIQAELDRTAEQLETARAQVVDLQDRVVAAEDEARAARRELRDARARVESLMRENRTARIAAARARVPSATPDAEGGEFRAARLGPGWAEGAEEEVDEVTDDGDADAEERDGPQPDDAGETGAPASEEPEVEADRDELDEGDDAKARQDGDGDGDGDTAPLSPVPDAGDAPTTASLEAVEPGSPRLWRDDDGKSVRVLRPRTPAGRLRPAPALDDADDDTGEEEVLDPAAVGARAIRPAETPPRHPAIEALSNPRVIVGGIFALLLLALILIFSGVGLV